MSRLSYLMSPRNLFTMGTVNTEQKMLPTQEDSSIESSDQAEDFDFSNKKRTRR